MHCSRRRPLAVLAARSPGVRHGGRLRQWVIAPTVVGAALVLLGGCASEYRGGSVAADRGAASASTAALPEGPLDVEQAYIIGPSAAAKLGFRIDWQYGVGRRPLRRFAVQHDSVFILDERNYLTRLRREEGDRLWEIPVGGGPMEDIQGITFVSAAEKVYLTSGGELLVLDAVNGSQVAKQKLGRIAATEPIVVGQFFIYGSRRGQVVWHSYTMGSEWRGYQVSHSIQIPPVYHDGHIVAVGNDGRVMCLRADSATQVWSKKALAPVVAAPKVGNDAVYVASRDQHLRAYELTRARSPLWEYLTESPLTESPVLIDDRVYQQVPTEGLVCLEALPLDSPGGVVIWRAEEATGSVLTQLRDTLITWDAGARELALVDARLGAVIETFDMPQVDKIIATDVRRGDIYATGHDGRIIRLVPRT